MPTSASPRSHDPSSELAFGLLGPLAVWRNSREVDLGPPQQRALLTVLLLHRNRPVSIDYIVDALWPHGAPESGVQAIRTYASRLRHLLSPDHLSVLRADAGTYRLLVSSGQTDVDRFEEHASVGQDALDAGDLPTAERHLRAARDLVRGPPLRDALDLPEVHAEAERLDELRLMVEESLVDVQLAQGRHRRVIPVLRALIRSDPHDERFWAQLMLALYRAGRQADALAVYREARTALRDQLGLDPGPELQQLERMILLQERTLDHHAVGLLHGVPRYGTTFVGRTDALEDLSRLLRRTRWISIVGPPGVGKSRLAAELAARARSSAPDGVWWVDLEGMSPSSVAGAIGRAVALRESAPERIAGLITARLRGIRALLILDGCDASAAAVARLAQQVAAETEGVRILTTCRRPTRADTEHVYRLRPLATPAAGDDALAAFATEAGRLLADRAEAAGGSVLTDPMETAQLLRRLDGLPLAIELAAGRLSSLSAMELNRALADDLRLLTSARPGLGAAAPLERALEQSLSALDHAEHRLLLRLSVFGGTFTVEGATAVAPRGEAAAETTLALTDLVERSLVMAEVGEPTRYRLLVTVRSYLSGPAGVRASSRRRAVSIGTTCSPTRSGSRTHARTWLRPRPLASAAHADLLRRCKGR